MLNVFKWSCNAHIMFTFQTLHSVYLSNLGIFVQKKPLNFYFKTTNHFSHEITRLVMNTRLITALPEWWYVQNYWVLLIYAFYILWLKAIRNFHYTFLGRSVLLLCDFPRCQRVQSISKCKYFLLFYHDKVMLNYWYYARLLVST